jgi:hypothetical protein
MGLRGFSRAWVVGLAMAAGGWGAAQTPLPARNGAGALGSADAHLSDDEAVAKMGHRLLREAQAAQKKDAPETVMTTQQAKELFASVDDIMAFASKDSGLPPVINVKRKLLTRAEVNAYLMKSFDEDEGAKRLQQSEIVLKKFGLLNRDFDLRPFLLSLLTEQIAGFYDDKTKTVNLLNWVKPDEQKPVLAHELTHAIQDQKVGLEKWSTTGFKGTSKTAAEDAERIPVDELETARQAVTEGQAMVVFVDWGLPQGQTLADEPEIGKAMKDSAADTSSSPVMARAPLLLQRSLVFPYADGLAFEQALLIKGGKQAAFTGALTNPPNSSFEIMNPAAYLAHAPVPLLRLPNIHPLLDAEYDPYDLGVMGELDVEIMADLFGGEELGTALAQQWNGGVYYAGQRKSASAAEKLTPASLGVFYLSRWKEDEAAATFEKIYSAQLGRKYSGVSERKQDEADGELVYTTSEGDVLMSLTGRDVWVSEGFPLPLARKLRDLANGVQGTGPMKMATGDELTLRTAGALAGFGMVNPATLQRYTFRQGFRQR